MLNFFSHDEPPESKIPVCPKCGAETDTFCINADDEIIGCDECVRKVNAWEVA